MSQSQQRIVELQRQVKVAKSALAKIACGINNPDQVADDAIYEMRPMDPKVPLQGIVGHERQRRS